MKILIRDLVDGYVDNDEEGVFGYGGRLNIRPKYQREFIYGIKERNAVIASIQKGFPLNTMYWIKNGNNFELLDGQQRTVSICRYVRNVFSVIDRSGAPKLFSSLPEDKKKEMLNYPLNVYFCEGPESEILDWFAIINIAGLELTKQERRNAVYTGLWLTDAKRHFSKSNCAAYGLASKYVNGRLNRQEYLETAIAWIVDDTCTIEDYMAKNKHADNASELWQYFQDVIHWVQTRFSVYRDVMKGAPWGRLYNRFKDASFEPAELEERIKELMMNKEVNNKRGIYEYVLTGEERHLNIRTFDETDRWTVYERQNGICAICEKHFTFEQMQGDHIKSWRDGGKTELENCQMLCRLCNQKKGAR